MLNSFWRTALYLRICMCGTNELWGRGWKCFLLLRTLEKGAGDINVDFDLPWTLVRSEFSPVRFVEFKFPTLNCFYLST